MGYSDEEAYEEMIRQLTEYKKSVEENCAQMMTAATDCVDNTHNDPASVTAKGKLSDSVTTIKSHLEVIDEIIQALREELDDIIIKNRKGQQYGE